MIKVAYIVRNFCAPSESFIRDLVAGLSRDFEVKVFANQIVKEGGEVANVEVIKSPFLNVSGRCVRLVRYGLRACQFDPDNFEACYRSGHAERALAKRLLNFGPNVIFTDYGTTGVLLRRFAKAHSIPLIVHFHGYDASSALKEVWYRNEVAKLVEDASAIIVPSQHIERMLRIETGTIRGIEYIPCGPNLSVVKQLSADRSDSPFVISALGRLTAKKNPLALLEAFRLVAVEIPEARLEWVGDGELRARVEARIRKHGLENKVRLHGALSHRAALQVIANSSVFVQHSVTAPSGDQEGLPVAILEALAFGVPIVSTLHSGIPEAVEEGVNGFLVREHDFESMADRVIQLLQKEVVLPASKGSDSAYSLDKRVKQISKLLVAVTEHR